MREIQHQAADVAADRNHPVHDLVDDRWLASAVKADASEANGIIRHGIERVLNLAVWLEKYRPELKF